LVHRVGSSDLRVAAWFCGAVGLYDITYVLFTMFGGPLIGPRLDVLFPDFLVFHGAARAWAEGKAAMVYEVNAFTQFQNALYFQGLDGQAYFRPFFYPPIWLVMLLPFAWLTATKAYALFIAVTAAIATALVGRHDWTGWLAVLVSPAAVWVVLAGQNTFLSVTFFYGGMGLIDRVPAAAGILLGLLAYKPQLFVLIPVALIAARRWRVLAWTSATVVAVSLTSLAMFGTEVWQAFLASAREGSAVSGADAMFESFRLQMVTLFAAVRLTGFAPATAQAVQLTGAALSAAVVWLGFRRQGPSEPAIALLAALTFLVSPYTMNYDLLLLMPAVLALFRFALAQGFYPGERLLHPLLWLCPVFVMMLNDCGLPLVPMLIALFAALAFARLRTAAKVELPASARAR
jgi:alpha-1,2-mannosyltransferase